MKPLHTLLLSVALTSFVFGTTAQELKMKKNAISANILGTPGFLGVTYERLIIPKLGAEIGIGVLSAGAGIKYYPLACLPHKWNFYLGASGFHFRDVSYSFTVLYAPVGLHFIGKKRLNFSFDIGPSFNQDSRISIWGGLKIGCRF